MAFKEISRLDWLRLFFGASLLFANAGCGSFHLRVKGERDIVIPPRSAKSDFGQTLVVPIAAQALTVGPSCDISGGMLRLTSGKRPKITIDKILLEAEDRVPLYKLDALEAFRREIRQLETKQCLPPGQSTRLLYDISAEVPMPSLFANYLRYGAPGNTGYVDLLAPAVVKLVQPLPDAAGLDTSGYRVLRYGVGIDSKLRPLSAESIRGTTRTSGALPESEILNVPPRTTFLRLFVTQRQSRSDHSSVLVGTDSVISMAEFTSDFLEGRASCDNAKNLSYCRTFAPKMPLAAEVALSVNGKAHYVFLGGTVRDMLRDAGIVRPESMINRLRVRRLSGDGKLKTVSASVRPSLLLDLVLIGGEDIYY